jgi:hypothetical protein
MGKGLSHVIGARTVGGDGWEAPRGFVMVPDASDWVVLIVQRRAQIEAKKESRRASGGPAKSKRAEL